MGNAVISDCGKFRYILRRSWNAARPVLGYVMLNPSTADAEKDDPTIRKCIGFADRLGYGAIVVTNLYAFRATSPADLKRAAYPVGPENDEFVAKAAREARDVICAWGANARGLVRPTETLRILASVGRPPLALRILPCGTPSHPLMLPYTCAPIALATQGETP